VRVSLLTTYVSDKSRAALQVAALVVGIGFFGWLIWETIPWFEFAYKRNLKTETTRILLYPWMALMPLSLAVTGVILVARLVGIVEHEESYESKLPTSCEGH
jgi:TRAP-type C4-dicarboxylate transport system permease small subunit